MINQLFKQVPDKEFLIKLLKCFGLTGLDDTNEFTKNKLASKAVAYDHLTYLLLTQNRWISP